MNFMNRKRDGELSIRQKELQLEHRHAQLKEQLSARLSCGSEYSYSPIKSIILNEMNKFFMFIYRIR